MLAFSFRWLCFGFYFFRLRRLLPFSQHTIEMRRVYTYVDDIFHGARRTSKEKRREEKRTAKCLNDRVWSRASARAHAHTGQVQMFMHLVIAHSKKKMCDLNTNTNYYNEEIDRII